MSQPVNHTLRTLLPPAPITQRVLAVLCDALLILLLCSFVIGKIWLPLYFTEALLQFQSILETYAHQLNHGQIIEFFQQFKNNEPVLQMFQSIDRWLFLITWAYYSINAGFFQGGTIGKQIFNLRVLKIHHLQPLTLIDSILRAGLLTFFFFTAFPLLITFSFFFLCLNPLHRGFHDWCCQTYVVNCSLLEQIKGQISDAVRSTTQSEESRIKKKPF